MKYIIMSLIEHSCAYLLTFFICSLMELQSVVIDIILLIVPSSKRATKYNVLGLFNSPETCTCSLTKIVPLPVGTF